MRAHTDPSLGHCSYLNTCYSEPTYAMSPSIPSLPSAARSQNTASLPSGLGAGGRGKEKAPCRYLHFEVDYNPDEDGGSVERGYNRNKGDGSKLSLGLGPGKGTQAQVRIAVLVYDFDVQRALPSCHLNGSTATFESSTIPFWASFMLSWQTHLGIST